MEDNKKKNIKQSLIHSNEAETDKLSVGGELCEIVNELNSQENAYIEGKPQISEENDGNNSQPTENTDIANTNYSVSNELFENSLDLKNSEENNTEFFDDSNTEDVDNKEINENLLSESANNIPPPDDNTEIDKNEKFARFFKNRFFIFLLIAFIAVISTLLYVFRNENINDSVLSNTIIVKIDATDSANKELSEKKIDLSNNDNQTSIIDSNLKNKKNDSIIKQELPTPDTLKKNQGKKEISETKRQIEEIISDIVYVEGGKFKMGSLEGDSDERPVHEVTINSFYIDRYEVTVAKYKAFCNATGREMPKEPAWGWIDEHPIVNVSWNDAADYAIWMGKRLPTEAEWEFAARGGNLTKTYKYSGGNDPNSVATYNLNSKGQPSKVGSRNPNELGIYDMSGNIWEWCQDWYSPNYYLTSTRDNPQGTKSGRSPTLRGGSWHDSANELRISKRSYNPLPSYKYFNIGFRCVQDLLSFPDEEPELTKNKVEK